MTLDSTTGRVLAAVAASPSRSAVVFAAQEAQRRGATLQLMHVFPEHLPATPLPLVPEAAAEQCGRRALSRAGSIVAEVAPEVDVAATMVVGRRVSSIVEEAAGAELVVLGTHHARLAASVWTGATVTGVSARATCPVVVVPDVDERAEVQDRVVVGVKWPRLESALLATAWGVAEDLHAEVVVLHAWKLPSGYDDVISTHADMERWHHQLTASLETVLTGLRRVHPEVPVRVEVVHGQAARVLVDASADADRLLISRPVHGGYLHHLGATARAVLRDTQCPVEVCPPAHARIPTRATPDGRRVTNRVGSASAAGAGVVLGP